MRDFVEFHPDMCYVQVETLRNMSKCRVTTDVDHCRVYMEFTILYNLIFTCADLFQANSDFPVQIKFTPEFEMIKAAIKNGNIVGEVVIYSAMRCTTADSRVPICGVQVEENDTCDVKIPVSILVPDRQVA